MKILLLLILVCSFFIIPNSFSLEPQGKQPIEVGIVSWHRDFEKSLVESKNTNKPILALFQEVPGCHGCKSFGKEVLSNKKLAKKIEDNFIPVLIYNNRGGKDSQILKRYKEPAWNFQVIRFLDHNGDDILPRRDKVWSLEETDQRIDKALNVFNSKKISKTNNSNNNTSNTNLEQIAFAQHCFWTGEMELGGIEGVKKTEAGFYNGHEVTKVWFDKNKIDKAGLNKKAKSLGVASKTYAVDQTFENKYRKAPKSDQKRQLRGTQFENAKLSDFQATKINAFVRKDRSKVSEFLKQN